MDEMRLKLWVLDEEQLGTMLERCYAGEEPWLVMAEAFANEEEDE